MNVRPTRSATYFAVAAILFTLAAAQGTAAQGAGAAVPPAVALICEQRNELPWVDAAEVALASDARFRLVDREHLSKVLEEQKLALLIGPADGENRIRVGRLVGCDLLVIVRHEPKPRDVVRMVIADTRTGIRLVTAEFPARHAAETRRLPPALLTTALEKRAVMQPIVLAIPPFVNDDLSRSNQFLQDSLATVCATVAARNPRILLVELEEARELAKENALTARQASRVLPHYLLGRFRLESANAERPPQAVLRLERGNTLLAERKHESPKPAEIGTFVQSAAAELLSSLADKHGDTQVDNAADAARLAEQALEFFKISDYEQGARVAEAGLLLRPDQLDLRHTLRNVYKDLTYLQYDDPRMDKQRFDRQFQKALFFAERNLEHLRIYLAGINTRYTGNPAPVNAWAFDRHDRSNTAVHAALVKHQRDYQRMLTETIELKIKRGQTTGDMQSLLSSALGYYHKEDDGPQKEYLTRRLPLLRLVEGTPQQRRWFYKEILTWGIALYDADAFAFYESLFNESDPELVAAAKDAKEEGEFRMGIRKRALPPVQPRAEPPVLTRSDVSVRLTPVEFDYLQDGRRTAVKMQRILTDERGHEVVCGHHAAGNSEYGDPLGARVVLHHRGPEPFRKIFEADQRHAFGFGCYDGKYFWLPVSGGNRERAMKGASAASNAGPTVAELLRIDAVDGTVVRVGVEQGLPDVQGSFNTAITAPLEPGRIALVATFGMHRAKRTFIAEITGGENGPPRVRVVHEAREEYLGTDRRSSEEQALTNPKLNYTPKFVLPFSEPGSAASTHRAPTHLLIARTVTGNPYQDNTLVVELATGKAVIHPAEAHGHLAPWDFVIRDGAAYYATYNKVWRISPADLTKREAVADLVEDDGALYFTKDGILLIGRECWFTEDWSKPFRQVADNEENFIYTYINEHYYSSQLGPLLKAMLPSRIVKLYRVELLRNAKSAK